MTNDEIIEKIKQSNCITDIVCTNRCYCSFRVNCIELFLKDTWSIDDIIIYNIEPIEYTTDLWVYALFINEFKNIEI